MARPALSSATWSFRGTGSCTAQKSSPCCQTSTFAIRGEHIQQGKGDIGWIVAQRLSSDRADFLQSVGSSCVSSQRTQCLHPSLTQDHLSDFRDGRENADHLTTFVENGTIGESEIGFFSRGIPLNEQAEIF